jgi:hypothetical protein
MGELLVVDGVFPDLCQHAGAQLRLCVALFATPGDDQPLWSDVLPSVPIGAGGAAHLVLGIGAALPASVFERYPRYLSVAVDGAAPHAPRVPVSGAAVRHAARLAALESGAGTGGVAGDTERMLARLPSRLRSLGEGFADVHARLVAVEDDSRSDSRDSATVDQLLATEQRLGRVEDQVEDLVGPPHGEVVALAGRVAALEVQVAALGAALARLAEALPVASAGPPDVP